MVTNRNHSMPKRVLHRNGNIPILNLCAWYLHTSDVERTFIPIFELLLGIGHLHIYGIPQY